MPVLKKQDYWIVQSTKHKTFESQYEIGKELGRGVTSSVFKCQRKGLSQTWALKILNKNTEKKVSCADVGILLKLDHRNLVRLKEIFESRSRIFLVQELVTGGELFDRIVNVGTYSEAVASKAVKDIANGLCYLHGHGLVHRNLKPENLLYENLAEDSPLKISDFGLSSIISPEIDMSSVCGYPSYCAPDVLKGDRYGAAADMWTVGVIVYILLCGEQPFVSEKPEDLFKKIIKGQYEFSAPEWNDIGENAKDLVKKLLILDPKKRMTAMAASTNCWVNGYVAKHVHLEDVVEKIKDFNLLRKEKHEVLTVAQTPRSRMSSRATSRFEGSVTMSPLPGVDPPTIEIQTPNPLEGIPPVPEVAVTE